MSIKQLSGTLFELRLRKAEPETRIYIVKKEREGVIIVLSAGTKDTQAKDIKWCKQVAKELKSHEQLTENY